MLRTETANRKAFEQVTSAMELINQFEKSADYAALDVADAELSAAMRSDPDYLGAIFYSGIVKDLSGRAADASAFFERIAIETNDDRVRAEAFYNLGVAFYHQYHKPELLKAQQYFQRAVDLSPNHTLRLLAQANIAQALAMQMHPSAEELSSLGIQESAVPIKQTIQAAFNSSLSTSSAVLKELENVSRSTNEALWKKVEATAHNALGMAYMYSTDYLVNDPQVISDTLREAISHFVLASDTLPKDWAVACNIASAHLRFFARVPGATKRVEFEAAKNQLEMVLTVLRPRYGFAYYELGRLFRCAGKFDDAAKAFTQSLAIESRYRDVSDRRIHREQELTRFGDVSFP